MLSPEQVDRILRLAASGLNKSQIARATGVSRSTVRRWLESGLAGFDRCRRVCPICAAEVDRLQGPEYLYLLGLYLGDGTLSAYPRGVYRLRIACANAYPGLIAKCEAAMRAVLSSKVGLVRATGCVEVYSYSRHWPCMFPQHGPGRKHTRRIELVAWQQRLVDEDPRPLIRGLIHSDGCRVLNRAAGTKYPPYPRYHFSNMSTDIRKIFGAACDAIGVEWRHNNATTISIARRASVGLLDSFVGPKH